VGWWEKIKNIYLDEFWWDGSLYRYPHVYRSPSGSRCALVNGPVSEIKLMGQSRANKSPGPSVTFNIGNSYISS
jgi:hypothetical protein